ncbi:hypothetical protein BST61_g5213 [Cercospora zeina]
MTVGKLTTRERAIRYFQALNPGGAGPGEATEYWKDVDELADALSRAPTFHPRPVKILAVGAGFSGLALARAVRTGHIPIASLTVYEKNADVGGTWYENRYPGCVCDIPAPNYQHQTHTGNLTMRSRARFATTSTQSQTSMGCGSTSRPDTKSDLVVSSNGVTAGETSEVFEEECDILVNCSGFFNNWKWPDIKDRDAFKGRLMHSAAWPADADPDLDGKTVTLIGNGSSGVQILPAILDRDKKVYVHIKSRTWVTASIAQRYAGPRGTNFDYTPEQKAEWAKDPQKHLEYRKMIEEEINARFPLYVDHTTAQKEARIFSINDITTRLRNGGKEELLQQLLPDFAVGCRRPTPGDGYLEALCHPKIEIIWGKVEQFTADEICTVQRTTQGVDTIICATGFDLTCAPRVPIVGLNGVNLMSEWTKNPQAYLSVTAANMPNYFVFMGPNSSLGHGSLVTSIEMVTKYVSAFVRKLQTQNYSYCIPKPHIPVAYQKQALAWLARTVWASNCFTEREINPKKDTNLTWFLDFDSHTKPLVDPHQVGTSGVHKEEA